MKRQTANKILFWLVLLIIISCASGSLGNIAVTGDGAQTSSAPPAKAKITAGNDSLPRLRSLDQLKDVFRRDTGKVRLVALLSPT